MTLTQLEYILAVDKFRHFGKAAKFCNISQPTLSMQLQKAEEEICVVIFDRSKNPILPTNEGIKIIDQARIVIKEYKKIFDIIDQDKHELSGNFKLGVIPTLAPYLIPLFAGAFSRKYPKVNLIIEEYKTEEIIKLLDNDEIDAGLLVTPLQEAHIIERALFKEAFYVFASKNHEYFKKNKIKMSEINSDDLWLLNEGHCFRSQVLNICGIKDKSRQFSNLNFESGNLETLKNMVLNNNGYTLFPELAVINLSKDQHQFVREFQGTIPSREVSLVHNRIFLKEKIIDALEAVIIQNLPKELESHKKKNFEIIPI
jgi:LysR family hydrogen peroxide-inducible transcriptional activator